MFELTSRRTGARRWAPGAFRTAGRRRSPGADYRCRGGAPATRQRRFGGVGSGWTRGPDANECPWFPDAPSHGRRHRRDFHRCGDFRGGWLRERKVADHPRRSGAWGERGDARRSRARRSRAGRRRYRDSRDDARHQRHHREKRGGGRCDHHRGISGHSRDRLRTALRPVRHLSRQAGPPGAAGALPHGAGTHRRRRRSLAHARRGGDGFPDGSRGTARDREPGHRPAPQLCQPRPRAAFARAHLRAAPGSARFVVLRSVSGESASSTVSARPW